MTLVNPLTRLFVGKRVLHWTGRLCKIIALHPKYPHIFIKLVDANTGGSFDDISPLPKWSYVNGCSNMPEENSSNWLHEGF